MLDSTYQYLTDHGFARGEARANTGAIADACIAKMLERTVEAVDVDEITDKGLLATELRELVLGAPDDDDIEADLDDLVTRMTSPEGTVQHRLENGFVLCSARVNRNLPANGGEATTVKRAVRFLSETDDVIQTFYCTPQFDAAVKKVEGVNRRWDLVVHRRPTMASRRQTFLNKAQQRLALELGDQR